MTEIFRIYTRPNHHIMQRRKFLRHTSKAALGLSALGLGFACSSSSKASTGDSAEMKAPTLMGIGDSKWFDISLAQWSLNKALFGGEMDNLDFAKVTRQEFGLGGMEYVSQFFKDKANDAKYLAEMNDRADSEGVKQLLIMIDREGNLGATDKTERMQAVDNHHKWVDAAKTLGCHSIRVNAAGEGTREEVAAAATEGLASLSEYAKTAGMNVIVENHGGYSSDGEWLSNVIKNTGMNNCGTLPDFGNFCIERSPDGCKNEYDRYKGVTELMPYAKAVSAKTNDFEADGLESHTDYEKILGIVKDHGYSGWIGIEYEGSNLAAKEGIRKTIDVLQRFGGRVA